MHQTVDLWNRFYAKFFFVKSSFQLFILQSVIRAKSFDTEAPATSPRFSVKTIIPSINMHKKTGEWSPGIEKSGRYNRFGRFCDCKGGNLCSLDGNTKMILTQKIRLLSSGTTAKWIADACAEPTGSSRNSTARTTSPAACTIRIWINPLRKIRKPG